MGYWFRVRFRVKVRVRVGVRVGVGFRVLVWSYGIWYWVYRV